MNLTVSLNTQALHMKAFERLLHAISDAANCRNIYMSKCRSFNTDQCAGNFRVPHKDRILSAITGT